MIDIEDRRDALLKIAQFVSFSGWSLFPRKTARLGASRCPAVSPVPGKVFYVNAPDHNVQVAEPFIGRRGLLALNEMTGLGWDGRAPLGHAGVLTVDGNGRAKYYDYGRYRKDDGRVIGKTMDVAYGNVRNPRVRDWPKGMAGDRYAELLADTLGEGKLELYGADSNDIGAVGRYMEGLANKGEARDKYSVLWHNCGTVARDAFDAGMGGDRRHGAGAQAGWHGFTPSQNAPRDSKMYYSYEKAR